MGETTEYPMIDRFFMQVPRLLFDTDAIRFEKAEALQIATELRALLAERAVLRQECKDRAECEQSLARWNDALAADRDAWQAKAEDAERRLDDEKALRFEAQRPAARRLRAVQFDGYDDWYRWNDGQLEALVGNPLHWKVQKHIRTEWIEAVAALRDDPFEPVETLEEVVCSAVREWNDTAHKTGADCSELVANAVRTWIAQQPTPPQDAATTRGEG
jgi:hypothetical protein